MNPTDLELSENETAAALAAALYRFGADCPGRIEGTANGLAANYRYQRDRLARIAAGTSTAADREAWPDDSYVERDHDYVSRYLGHDPPTVRRFHLVRDVDETGVSGTGIVAEGVARQHSGQGAALYWRTRHSSVCFYQSMEAVEAIHGHGGKTRIVYVDSLV